MLEVFPKKQYTTIDKPTQPWHDAQETMLVLYDAFVAAYNDVAETADTLDLEEFESMAANTGFLTLLEDPASKPITNFFDVLKFYGFKGTVVEDAMVNQIMDRVHLAYQRALVRQYSREEEARMRSNPIDDND